MKRLLYIAFCLFLLGLFSVNCQNIPDEFILGKGQIFKYIYRGWQGDELSNFQQYNKFKSAFILINDNPKYNEYCVDMTLVSDSYSREQYPIKNTRTILQNGDRWIVYETINKDGESVIFYVDPKMRFIHFILNNVQVIFTNIPKSNW